MARKPKRKAAPRRDTRRQDPARPKLDARLAFLLSLSGRQRNALKVEEDARLVALGKEIAATATTLYQGSESKRRLAAEKLRELDHRLFAPLTMGLFVPPEKQRGKARFFRTDEAFVSAMILCDASARDLEALGAKVRSQAGDVFTAFIPLSAIARLEKSAAVRYIELARPLFPTLNDAVQNAQLDTLHAGPPAVDGTGVIVGVVDDVLDIYHPDFRTAAGATRVLFLWDQKFTPQAGETGPSAGTATYGVEYSRGMIDAELNHPATVPFYQTVRHGLGELPDNHGTHVAGIAAGNGFTRPARTYAGAAPGADIIFVAAAVATAAEHDETHYADNTFVLDAFDYIFAHATALGQPCVVNLSNSDNQGAHDGTSLGERFLDSLLDTPGRAIVLSAGNSNNTASHAAGNVTTGVGNTVDLVLRYDPGTNVSDAVEIWYDGHDRFDVTVTLPSGASSGVVAPGVSPPPLNASGIKVQVTSVLNDPRNGDNVISILFVVPNGQSIPAGNTTIRLAGTTVVNGAFHAWVDRNNRGRSRFTTFLQEDTLTLGVPATARRAITVGNHDKVAPPGIYKTSGRGPSRDGRVKPEIATVGMGLDELHGVTAPKSENRTTAAAGGRYVEMLGTSMSAPLVAGACACLFQCRGANTTWADLKQILQDTAGAAGPVNAFGYGFMQIGTGCEGPMPKVDVWLRDNVTDTGAEPFTGEIAWLSPDIEVLDRNGNPVANPSYDPIRRFNNIIRVTVRNRGTNISRNTEVHFYWADPATNIPYPEAWKVDGIYNDSPGFVNQSNKIVVAQIPAGGNQAVQFGWAPPTPGSNIRGDDHFCLLVRLENEGDPSLIGAGGWSAITASNNIALHNIHVQPAGVGDASFRFYFVGTADHDSMTIFRWLRRGELKLHLPVQALPWRDIRLIEGRREPRPEYGRAGNDPLTEVTMTLKGDQVRSITGIIGADVLELRNGIATVTMGEGPVMRLPHVRIANRTRMATRIHIARPKVDDEHRFVHVAQHSDGRLTGGVSLELRPRPR
jgi:hypothetical protein